MPSVRLVRVCDVVSLAGRLMEWYDTISLTGGVVVVECGVVSPTG